MIDVGAGGTITLDFALDPEALLLEGIVAVGYGTQQRRDLTGAAAPIRIGEVGGGPAGSVDQVMQGQAAGVQVTTASGAPGGAVSVRIRVTNSISANAEPLYVIDEAGGHSVIRSHYSTNTLRYVHTVKSTSCHPQLHVRFRPVDRLRRV